MGFWGGIAEFRNVYRLLDIFATLASLCPLLGGERGGCEFGSGKWEGRGFCSFPSGVFFNHIGYAVFTPPRGSKFYSSS